VTPLRRSLRAQHLLVDTPTPMPHPLDVLVQAPRASSDLHRVLLAAWVWKSVDDWKATESKCVIPSILKRII
jgi:hypothetical protein